MKIDRIYRPWLACGSDDCRPVLEHVLIERMSESSGVAVAADGCIMAVVPVTLEAEEQVGMIPGRLLRYARACPSARVTRVVELRLDGEMLRMPDGSLHPIEVPHRAFPDWRKIVAMSPVETTGEPVRRIKLDVHLLLRLSTALGGSETAVPPTLRFGGYHEPMVVTIGQGGTKAVVPPYGLLMPCVEPHAVAKEPLADREAAEKPVAEVTP